MDYSAVVKALGGTEITVSQSTAVNPLDIKMMTIDEIMSMSMEEKVEWILRQPVGVVKGFLRFKSVAGIKELNEEEKRVLITRVVRIMPEKMFRRILWETGVNDNE